MKTFLTCFALVLFILALGNVAYQSTVFDNVDGMITSLLLVLSVTLKLFIIRSV